MDGERFVLPAVTGPYHAASAPAPTRLGLEVRSRSAVADERIRT